MSSLVSMFTILTKLLCSIPPKFDRIISDRTAVQPTLFMYCYVYTLIILEWTTSLDTSSRTLFVREGQCVSGCPRHVERRVT